MKNTKEFKFKAIGQKQIKRESIRITRLTKIFYERLHIENTKNQIAARRWRNIFFTFAIAVLVVELIDYLYF